MDKLRLCKLSKRIFLDIKGIEIVYSISTIAYSWAIISSKQIAMMKLLDMLLLGSSASVSQFQSESQGSIRKKENTLFFDKNKLRILIILFRFYMSNYINMSYNLIL